MHGLINRAFQCFLRDTYGEDVWSLIMQQADLGYTNFESMLSYDDAVTFKILDLTTQTLRKSRDDVLEDMGTYLVSHESVEALRRLLRFGGGDFVEFLYSLNDLPDRAKLAVPDLTLPSIQVDETHAGEFQIRCEAKFLGFGYVMVGIIRTMADDYGALAFTDFVGIEDGEEVISINILDDNFADGRVFDLAEGLVS